MSWSHWPGAAAPQPSVVATTLPGTMLNPAAAVINPAPTVLPPGTQYTPEQWAQMQQQNWQQWAQWQQQFQQWQQQYGAQYQKSLSAMGVTAVQPPLPAALPNVTAPPPLPMEAKPPLPPGEPPVGQALLSSYPGYTTAPPTQAINYNTVPNTSSLPPTQFQNSYTFPIKKPLIENPPPNQTVHTQRTNEFSSDNQYQNQGRNTANWQTRGQRNFNNQPGQGTVNQAPPTLMNLNVPKPDSGVHLNPLFGNKRQFSHSENYSDPKRNKFDQNARGDGWLQQNQQWNAEKPSTPQTQAQGASKNNPEELTEAEKKFDKQFADWEAQFQKWKEQNANHPDKVQYKEYEKKWETWRAQLLDRREQMRRKRLGLSGSSPHSDKEAANSKPAALGQSANNSSISSQKNIMNPEISKSFTQNSPYATGNPLMGKKPLIELNKPDAAFSRPPPNLNNDPLDFKRSQIGASIDSASEIAPEEGFEVGFLQSTSTGGIPGLDLVTDEKQKLPKDDETNLDKKGPDFDAISRGINSILGDQKLLSMLSIVSQKQNVGQLNSDALPKDDESNTGNSFNQSGHDYSNQEYDDYPVQNFNRNDNRQYGENVVNIDDQTRSSFGGEYGRDRYGRMPQSEDIRGGNYQPVGTQDRFAKSKRYGHEFNENFEDHDETDDANFREFDNSSRGGNFGGGPNEFNRRPEGYDRKLSVFDNSKGYRPNDFGRREGPDDFGKGPNNFNREPANFEREPANFEREPAGSGRKNQSRGPHEFERRFGQEDRRRDNFNRGANNFGEDDFGEDFGNGRDNQDISDDYGRRNFKQGDGNSVGGADKFDRGPEHFNKGHFDGARGRPDALDNFNTNSGRTSDSFRGGFDRGLNNFTKDPNAFGHDNFNNDFDNFDGDYDERNREFNVEDSYSNVVDQDDRQNFDAVDEWGTNDNSQGPSVGRFCNENKENIDESLSHSVQEELSMWKPEIVTDYDHKPLKQNEFDVTVEPLQAYDYRHKPLNRIPLPQRPKWLTESVKFYPEFDPVIARTIEPQHLRRYPIKDTFEPRRQLHDNYRKYEERRSYDRRQFEGEPFFESRRSYDNRHEDRRTIDESKRSFDDQRRFEDHRRPEREFGEYNEKHNRGRLFGDRRQDEDRKLYNERDSFQPKSEEVRFGGKSFEDVPPTAGANASVKPSVTLIEDIFLPPGRFSRPPRIVIVLRGPPGSGKTFLAKLIKDKEVENGGSAPRILSLDDYFMVEQEKEVIEDGRRMKVKEMEYEYEECMEASYRQSLMKAFKKTVTDGFFNFIIVDNVNDKVKYFGEMWSFAKQNGFQVYICQLDLDVGTCTKRNIHGRSEIEIDRIVAGWETTPQHHPVLDATSLIQSGSISEVEMEEINSPASDNEKEREEEQLLTSKWDKFDYSNDNLAKLDGTNKPLRPSRTMEDYLQLDNEWVQSASTKPGQKRVRWADLEERKQQEKMRAIGFVVGQTDWDRMMDPTMGGGALTQTKYIERVGRY